MRKPESTKLPLPSYNLTSTDQNDNFIIPDNKHTKLLIPSTKEWPNTTYSFNKNYIESSYHKTQAISKIMRNYFNFTIINKNSKNSKRMRDLVRRSSTKRFFVSRPEIKQSNDKIIYTVYVFNREKNFYSKKIHLLNKSLSHFNKYKLYDTRYLNYLNLSKVRPISRLGTINKLNPQVTKKFSSSIVNKTFFPKNSFLYSTTKGLVYYVNTHNTAKQKSLLELKTKAILTKQKKRIMKNKGKLKNRSKYLWGVHRINKNRNMHANPLFTRTLNQESFVNTRVYKKKLWRDLLKNKDKNYFSNRLFNLLVLSFNKKQVRSFKLIFFFNFLKWALSRFDLKIIVIKNKLIIKKNSKSLLLIKSETVDHNISGPYISSNTLASYDIPWYLNKRYNKNPYNKLGLLYSINQSAKMKILNKIKFNILSRKLKTLRKKLNRSSKKFKLLNKVRLKLLNLIKLNRLNRINTILFKVLLLSLSKGGGVDSGSVLPEKNVSILFNQFKAKYLWDTLKVSLMKQVLGVYYLYRNAITEFKYSKFLVTLKSNLLKIYNKTPHINIVDMKYLHLNSDMLIEGIAIKLKNKKTKLLRTVKRALKLIKLPENLKNNNGATSSVNPSNKLHDLLSINLTKMFSSLAAANNVDNWKSKELTNNKKLVNYNYNSKEKVNVNIYNSNEAVKNIFTDRKDKLDNLRHKWITGIKVEGKGRLTRRYRADRSLFKLKYKGNLKNINFKDIYNKNHLALKKTQSMSLLKGHTTPNIQYSFRKWKRHIGSYGIKGWISNN